MSELKCCIKAFQLRVEEPRNEWHTERETYSANFCSVFISWGVVAILIHVHSCEGFPPLNASA
jgi:hypothetical protein